MKKSVLKQTIIAILAVCLIFTGCTEDPSIFDGRDNYITSFKLEKDGNTYNVTFYGDSLIVTIPDDISLDGATVNYSISENASINPDPETITDWDDEILFGVTSYNGNRKLYQYSVNRNSINAEGTVVLSTQDEVDAFGELGKTSIAGNLVIGRTVGTDSITSLSALSELKSVGYSVIINPTYSGSDFTGLDQLEAVGGEIRIDYIETLSDVSFPGLKTVGGIYLKSEVITSVQFSELTSISNDATIDCPLSSLSLDNLHYTGGRLEILDAYSKGDISEVSLPWLEEAGELYFARFPEATKLKLPELKSTARLHIYYMPSLMLLHCPLLHEVTEIIDIYSPSIPELSFPSLTQAGGIDLETSGLQNLDLSALTSVTNDLYLQYLKIRNLDCLPSLTSVGGIFTIYNLTNMETFVAPSSLTSIGELKFYNYNSPPPSEIYVQGLDLGQLTLARSALSEGVKIIGDDDFHGTLCIQYESVSSGIIVAFPELEGFSTVDSLSFGGYLSTSTSVNVAGIKKINKGFHLPNGNETGFYLPDLEEVGGDFIINHFNRVTDETMEFPKLKTIDGDFDVKVLSQYVQTLSFPALESVSGNFTLATGYTATSLSSALFESLESIGGILTIMSYPNYSRYNTLMDDLDGFLALTSVAGVNITNQSALASFEGLKNCISSFSSFEWNVSDNAYNPTYEDMTSGSWTHE